MSRKLVIITCCLNALLGIAAIWLILKPRNSLFNNNLSLPLADAVKEYSDEDLWELAKEAPTARQAFKYLNLLSQNRDTLNAMARQVEAMADPSPLPFVEWPFFEAMLQNYGSRAESLDNLRPLARVAGQVEQALTLRDTSFRSFIENFSRLISAEATGAGSARDAGHDLEHPYALIDALSGEANSLSGTALLAEHYLFQNGFGREGGNLLSERAEAMLLDASALERNRLAAANVIFRIASYPDQSMLREALKEAGSERLKVALLQMISETTAQGDDLAWLESFEPTTPEQERLVRGILSRKTQSGTPALREPRTHKPADE